MNGPQVSEEIESEFRRSVRYLKCCTYLYGGEQGSKEGKKEKDTRHEVHAPLSWKLGTRRAAQRLYFKSSQVRRAVRI